MEMLVCDKLLEHAGSAEAVACELRISAKQVDNAAGRARIRMGAESRVQLLLAWREWRTEQAEKTTRRVHACRTCFGLGFVVRTA